MGDSIKDLSVNKEIDISDKDFDHVYKFFNVDLSKEQVSPSDNTSDKSIMEILKFVALFSIVFYACIHPLTIAKFVTNPVYRPIVQTLTFAVLLFLYLYFNK